MSIVQNSFVNVDSFKAVDITKKEVETIRQQAEKDEAQNDNKENMVEEMFGDILAGPFNDVFANICEKQSKKKE